MIARGWFSNTFNNINTFDIIKCLKRISRFSALLTPPVVLRGSDAFALNPTSLRHKSSCRSLECSCQGLLNNHYQVGL